MYSITRCYAARMHLFFLKGIPNRFLCLENGNQILKILANFRQPKKRTPCGSCIFDNFCQSRGFRCVWVSVSKHGKPLRISSLASFWDFRLVNAMSNKMSRHTFEPSLPIWDGSMLIRLTSCPRASGSYPVNDSETFFVAHVHLKSVIERCLLSCTKWTTFSLIIYLACFLKIKF